MLANCSDGIDCKDMSNNMLYKFNVKDWLENDCRQYNSFENGEEIMDKD